MQINTLTKGYESFNNFFKYKSANFAFLDVHKKFKISDRPLLFILILKRSILNQLIERTFEY